MLFLQKVLKVKNHMCARPKRKATTLSMSYFSGINLFRLPSTCQSVILLVEYVISPSSSFNGILFCSTVQRKCEHSSFTREWETVNRAEMGKSPGTQVRVTQRDWKRREEGRKQTSKLEACQDAAPREPVNLKTVPFLLHFCSFLRQWCIFHFILYFLYGLTKRRVSESRHEERVIFFPKSQASVRWI